MRQMNRVLVGTMLEVANGRRTLESFERLLEGRPREEAGADRAAARALPGRCAVLNRSRRISSVGPWTAGRCSRVPPTRSRRGTAATPRASPMNLAEDVI